jgi:hypothetical protein
MRVKVSVLCAGVIGLSLAASGCSESEPVTLHKPGVYKGAADPLVQKQGTPEQQEALLARFKQVQTDR